MAKKNTRKPQFQPNDNETAFEDINSLAEKQEAANALAAQNKGRKKRVLVSGAGFHDFESQPYFVGVFTGQDVKAEKDDGDRKAGDIMGFVFATEDGEEVLIGASYSIVKAVSQVKAGDKLEIHWKGLKEGKGGRTFNQYSIAVLED